MSARGLIRRAIRGVPPLDRRVRTLRRTDQIEHLQRDLAQARQDLDQARLSAAAAPGLSEDGQVNPFLTWAPPGHFYSPIPDMRSVRRQADRATTVPAALDGVRINADAQVELFGKLAALAADAGLAAEPTPDARYFANNPNYGIGDALMLQAFLRHLKPARYLEVGCGWSTAVALDTDEKWLAGGTEITCIEPFPANLRKLVREGDQVELIESPVQDVPLDRFAALEPNDVLFIDCSHVVKAASDALHLINHVLPTVPVGVYIHIHDIFWPFEYPTVWLEEGRSWTEAYLLHAFLLFNPSFEIVLFNDWLGTTHPDLVRSEVPAMAENAGAAIWLRRVS